MPNDPRLISPTNLPSSPPSSPLKGSSEQGPSPTAGGAITAVLGDVITGWAYDPANSQQILAIEIYLNGACVAVVRADLEEGGDGHGDGFHGFAYQIYTPWMEGLKSIAARVANGGPWLLGAHSSEILGNSERLAQNHSSHTPPSPEAASPPPSQVHYAGGLVVSGWAIDPKHPGAAIEVIAREGETMLASTRADRPHHSLVLALSTQHGYRLHLPLSLADGSPHKVHLETIGGEPLIGSPITVCCSPAGAAALLEGLALDPADPSQAGKKALLQRMLREHERLYPSACGFEFYPQWLSAFESTLETKPPPATPSQREPSPVPEVGLLEVGVLLVGTGSESERATSVASISAAAGNSGASFLPKPLLLHEFPRDPAGLQGLLDRHPRMALLVSLQIGDALARDALSMLLACHHEWDAAIYYGDCDQLTTAGSRTNPWFKPAWDETLFASVDYVSPGCALARSTLEALARDTTSATLIPATEDSIGVSRDDSRTNSEGVSLARWQALLHHALAMRTGEVVHLPRILYHRAATRARDPQAHNLGVLLKGSAEEAERLPTVSLIVPTRDALELLKTCLSGLLEHTDYPRERLEVIVIDNDSVLPETKAYLASLPPKRVRVIPYPGAFNYAAMHNLAVREARGEIIGFINNDIEVIEPQWLQRMVSELQRPGVAAVGAKLLWPNGMVQHGGVVLGVAGLAAHSFNDLHRDDAGYMGLNLHTREQSAVTAACMLLRKSDYLAVGGFDAHHFPVAFNDVDLCLRLRARGQKIVWCADAVLVHAESATRGPEDSPSKAARAQREARHLVERYGAHLFTDPYYHPNLALDLVTRLYGGLRLAPMNAKPRTNEHRMPSTTRDS